MLEAYKQLLRDYVAKKSISTDETYQSEIQQTVNWLNELLRSHGFDVTVVTGYDNPIVIAKYTVDPQRDTCLIYGHYDVQPAELEDGWESNPFTLRENNGRIYARGIVDNKGQNLVYIASIIELIKQHRLRYNVTFILEGDEETGSPHIEQFMQEKKDLLRADFSLISDGEISGGRPAIELGFRGGFNLTLTVKTSHTDLHSGLYGGAVPNAVHELTQLLAGLYDNKHRVTIPGFYDDVEEIPEQVLQANKAIPFDIAEFRRVTGTKCTLTEDGLDLNTQVGLLPTVQVTSIKAGYIGEGYRNSIPGHANAKLNFRVVLNQDPEKVLKLFTTYVEQTLPDYTTFEITHTTLNKGVKLNPDNTYIALVAKVIKKAYGREPLYKYCGASIPIVTLFHDHLNIPTVLVPLGNDDCGMHAANENFELGHVEHALEFSRLFFSGETV